MSKSAKDALSSSFTSFTSSVEMILGSPHSKVHSICVSKRRWCWISKALCLRLFLLRGNDSRV